MAMGSSSSEFLMVSSFLSSSEIRMSSGGFLIGTGLMIGSPIQSGCLE